MNIRTANAEDANQIYDIYAPIVENTAISFELTPPPIEEISKRIESYVTSHEWLVAEIYGNVIGYAYGTPHRPREAYKYSVETSVYVNENSREKGIGKQLYTELFNRLKNKGFHNAFAGIALPNDGSKALHESVGFKQVGVFHKIGFKHNSWHDVSWWQRRVQ